jgi:hypothetical protein
MSALTHTTLKIDSKCSFTPRKLRFLVDFCLVWLSLVDFQTELKQLGDVTLANRDAVTAPREWCGDQDTVPSCIKSIHLDYALDSITEFIDS